MRNTTLSAVVLLALGLIVCLAGISEAGPMGTAWTYQGRLIDANSAADGLYDLQFKLYDDPNIVTGNQVGGDVNVPDVDVIDGYFTVGLDFGGDVFDGDARWLDIGVRPGGETSAYTKLSPRQEVMPTPYSLHTYGLTVVGDNTFIGKDAGISNTTGNGNTFLGCQAGYYNTEGYNNTFSGYKAGYRNTTGNGNTFAGRYAGGTNTEGSANTFLGYCAGYYNKGGGNTFLGYRAGFVNSTGYSNTFSGQDAGRSNTTGNGNTFTGRFAGYSNSEGNYNTFSGYNAGHKNTTGSDNTFSGYRAGFSNTTGNWNTFSGDYAGYSNTEGHSNTFSGYEAGYSNTIANQNTFSGYQAGYYNTEGYDNTFSGYRAGYSNTEGYRNTFSGFEAGYSNTTGNRNAFSGYRAGYYNTEGYDNTFSGYLAGYCNTTGSGNVFIGCHAGYSETGSNKLYIANSMGTPLIYGDFSTGKVGLGTKTLIYRLQLPNTAHPNGQAQANAWKTYSSRRWKTNIQPIEGALEKVQELRGVSFDWKSNGKHDIGLIAEEVGQVLPEIVDYEENGTDATGMSYGRLTPLLIEAVKVLKGQVDQLHKENVELRDRLAKLEATAGPPRF